MISHTSSLQQGDLPVPLPNNVTAERSRNGDHPVFVQTDYPEEDLSDAAICDYFAPPVVPWPEPVDGVALLEALEQALATHLILPPHAAAAMALWVVHTHAFELRNMTAYLGIESPERRCGKTTLLTLFCGLANRPILAANITPSAFFRAIEENSPPC